MAEELQNTDLGQVRSKFEYGSFAERYPEYPQWLNGSVWALDLETDLHEPVNNFRANLHYQNKALNGNTATLSTRTVTRDGRKVLLVQAKFPEEG